jgi:hypothetical protein
MTSRKLYTKSIFLSSKVDYSDYLNLNRENLLDVSIESCLPNERERLIISQCSNLKTLRIFHSGMSDADFASLFNPAHRTLTSVTIHGYCEPSVHSLKTICDCCPSLEVLNFHLVTPLTGVDIPMIISSLPSLRVLSIGTKLTNDSATSLLSAFPGIDLWFKNFSDMSIELQLSILRNKYVSPDLNEIRVFVSIFLEFLSRHPTFNPDLLSDFIPRIIQFMIRCHQHHDSLKQVSSYPLSFSFLARDSFCLSSFFLCRKSCQDVSASFGICLSGGVDLSLVKVLPYCCLMFSSLPPGHKLILFLSSALCYDFLKT